MRRVMISRFLFVYTLVVLSACSTTNHIGTKKETAIENLKGEDLSPFIGKKVSVTGKTVNRRLGAVLSLKNGQIIFMNEMDSWPVGYHIKDHLEECKTVEVSGILTEKYDLPVFIVDDQDSTVHQGIPMPKGTDLKAASHRYLLKKYVWKEIK